MTDSLFRSVLKKVPWWAWVLFPVALVVLATLFFRRGKGLGGIFAPPPRVSPPSPPALDSEQAEEKREEIRRELKAEEEIIESEADELRRKIKDKFGELK